MDSLQSGLSCVDTHMFILDLGGYFMFEWLIGGCHNSVLLNNLFYCREKTDCYYTTAQCLLRLPRMNLHVFQALDNIDYHPIWVVSQLSASSILLGLTPWDKSEEVLSVTTQTIVSTFSTPDLWRFFDTDNHMTVLWQPVSKVMCEYVCLNTGKVVFDGKMIERTEHGKRHAALPAVSLRWVWWSRCVCKPLVFLPVFNSYPSTPSCPFPATLLLLLLTSPCPKAQHNTSTGVQTAAQ